MDTDYFNATISYISGNIFKKKWIDVIYSIKHHELLFGHISPMLASFFYISNKDNEKNDIFNKLINERLEGKDPNFYLNKFPDTWNNREYDYFNISVCYISGNLYKKKWIIVLNSIKNHEDLFGHASPMLAAFFFFHKENEKNDNFDEWINERLKGKDPNFYLNKFPDTWVNCEYDYFNASICYISGNIFKKKWIDVMYSIKNHELLFGYISPMLASFFYISNEDDKNDVFDKLINERLEGKTHEIYLNKFPDTWIREELD